MMVTISFLIWITTFFPASMTTSFTLLSPSMIFGLYFSIASFTLFLMSPFSLSAAAFTLAQTSLNPYCTISEESSSELEMNSPTITSTTSSLMVTRICLPVLIRVSLSFLRSSKICGLFSFRILMISPRILASSFLAADFTLFHKSENP